jgi:hypothetical protein
MNDKKAAEGAKIAEYKADAAERRRLSKTRMVATVPLAIRPKNGAITARFEEDAKPLSALGGIAKVLGHSRIDIPEFKLRRG